ncbi:MAG: phosphate acyltransferase [Ahrensia sp.]
MAFLDTIYERARAHPTHIIMSEGDDPRIQEASAIAAKQGLAKLTLLGDVETITAGLAAHGAADLDIEVISPTDNPDFDALVDGYYALRAPKGETRDDAVARMSDPIGQAAMRLRMGMGDATIGGSVSTTAHTVRAALQIIGRGAGVKTVSSFFLMVPPEGHPTLDRTIIFTDCALLIEPDADQLSDIAVASAQSCKALMGKDASIAFLSFSTAGSGEHPSLLPIREAVAKTRARVPELEVDGEFQFDAAFDDTTRAKKAPNSTLSSMPDIFVFPNLMAANIGYKIAQRLGGMIAVGPLLQGLAKPANDLSRGCKVDDIVGTIAMTAVQAQAR